MSIPIGPSPGGYFVDPGPSASPLLIPGMSSIYADTLAPSSTEAGRVAIIDYARAVHEAIDKLKQQLSKDAYQDNIQNNRFYAMIINRAIYLREILLNALEAAKTQNALLSARNQQVRDVNGQIDIYNAGVLAEYLGSYEDLSAVRTLYAGVLDFINPSSGFYLDESYILDKINDYGAYTGADMSTLIQAVEDFTSSGSPRQGDWFALGNALVQFFSRFGDLVNDANADSMQQALVDYFNPLSGTYHNISALDAAVQAYAPFLNPGYTPIQPPAALPINEAEETERVNQAILDYNNPISPYYQDADYLARIFAGYNFYRDGTGGLSIPINDIDDFLAISSPTAADVETVKNSVFTYDRYIINSQPIQQYFDDYEANPTPANLTALQNALTTYRNFLMGNPPTYSIRNDAVTTLNGYIDTYNALVVQNNIEVAQINQIREIFGLAPIVPQDIVDYRDYLPPPPSITDGSVFLPDRELYPRVPLFTQVLENDTTLAAAVANQFNTALIFFAFMGGKLSNQEIAIKLFQFLFSGINILNPSGKEELITPAPPASAPGVGYGSTALDLSSPFVEAVISSALIKAEFKEQKIPDSPEIIDAIKIATLQFAQDLSLFAGGATVSFLESALPTTSLLPFAGIDKGLVSIVSAVEFANQIGEFFSSGKAETAYAHILSTSPGLSDLTTEQIANASKGISDSIGAQLGVVSLVIISIALGTPGLSAQVLSLIPGIQSLDDNVLSPPIFADLVGNGLTATLVGNLLIGSGLDASASAVVLQAALASGQSPDVFYSSLQAALVQAGLSPEAAARLGASATNLILQQRGQASFTQQELDKVIMQGVIDREVLASALKSDEIAGRVIDLLNTKTQIEKSLLNQSILDDFRLQSAITQSDIQSNILRSSITQDAIRRDITLRDIRDAIRDDQVQNGSSIEDADIKARETIDQLREDENLNRRTELAFVDQEVLKNSIEKSLIAKGIEEDEAIKRAEIIADNLKRDREAFASRNSLRGALRDALYGEFGSQAGLVAAGLDLGIPPASPIGLLNFGFGPLTQYEFFLKTETLLAGLLADRISPQKLEELKHRLFDRLVENDNSLSRLIERGLGRTARFQDRELFDVHSDNIKQLVKPTTEIYAFVDKMQDPGNSLVYSIWSGIMYAGDQPENYKRSIDF